MGRRRQRRQENANKYYKRYAEEKFWRPSLYSWKSEVWKLTDITNTLLSAKSQKSFWSSEKLIAILHGVAGRVPGSYVEWEKPDEMWGCVLIGKEVVCTIYEVAPFCFCNRNFSGDVLEYILERGVLVHVYENFSDDVLTAKSDAISGVFGEGVCSNLNLDGFSPNDLWFESIL